MFTCTFEDGGTTTNLRHVTTAVIVVDSTGKKLLMIKRGPQYSEPNKWALPGGYIDRDETITQGAAREVLEETGYQITDLKLFEIIDEPNRPHEDKQNIQFTFTAVAAEKTGEADLESSEQTWVEFDQLPPADQWAFDHFESFQQFRKNV